MCREGNDRGRSRRLRRDDRRRDDAAGPTLLRTKAAMDKIVKM
jgi:hypothetical protein